MTFLSSYQYGPIIQASDQRFDEADLPKDLNSSALHKPLAVVVNSTLGTPAPFDRVPRHFRRLHHPLGHSDEASRRRAGALAGASSVIAPSVSD
jgi:hypothetical protein